MPYRKKLLSMLEEEKIRGVIILDSSGNHWWSTGVFPQTNGKVVDGYYLIYEWVTYPASTKIAGVKYLTLVNAYPNYWILTNMQGQGSLIIQKCSNGFYFVCYIDEAIDPADIQKEIEEIASLFSSPP
ncbi:MAG: hypothetical protein ACXABI_01235 [Candidatus Hodarchaeales archaeon]|jgi:hypothetical protein